MNQNPLRVRQSQAIQFHERALEQQGMLLVVTGMPGVGKTYFLRLIGDQATLADPRQLHNHYVYADEFEQKIPYSFIERLLSSGLTHDTLIKRDAQPVDVARRVLRHLVDLPEGGFRTVLIDDAQWIDEESIRVLRYLAPRVVQQGVFLVIAARSPFADESLVGSLSTFAETSPLHEHFRIEPVTVEEIQGYAVARFGTRLPTRTAESILHVTGGTFIGLEHIFAGVSAADVAHLHLTWDVQISGETIPDNPLLKQFNVLDEAGRVAVEIASLAERQIPRHTLQQVAHSIGATAQTEPGAQAKLLTETGYGASVQVAHQLIGRSVRDSMDATRMRQIYRALAEVSTGYDQIYYALNGAEEWDETLEHAVYEFVGPAVERGNYRLANDILRASLPLATGATRRHLLETLGLLHMRAKTAFEILDLLPEYEAVEPTVITESMVVLLRFYLFEVEEPRRRLAQLLTHPSTDPDVLTLKSFMAFLAAMMSMRSADVSKDDLVKLLPMAKQLWQVAPQDPSQVQDQRLAWMATPQDFDLIVDGFAVVPLHLNFQMEATRTQVEQMMARIAQRPDSSQKIDAMVSVAGALVALGEVERAHELAAHGMGLLVGHDQPWARGTIEILYAHTLVLQGRLTEARTQILEVTELVDDFIDVETRLTFAALRAWIAAVTQAEDPAPHLAESARLNELSWVVFGADLHVMAQCEIARGEGNPHAIIAATLPEKVDAIGNTQCGFLTYRAHALIDVGELDQAEELVQWLEQEQGRRWQPIWGSLTWLQARLAQARRQHDDAAQLYHQAVSEKHLSPLVEALTRLDRGEFLVRETTEVDAAREELRHAAELLSRLGAQAYLPRVRTVLGELDDRQQLAHLEVLAHLTNRELDVARRVADGYSNRQIADALFVSQATVRFHVSNVLRKLDIDSRTEVAQMFRGPTFSALKS